MTSNHSPLRLLFWSGLLLSVCLLLFIELPLQRWPRSLQALWNLGHTVLFAITCLWLLQRERMRQCGLYRQLLYCLALAVTAGILIEAVQLGTGRSSSWKDVLLGCLGAWLAVSWQPLPARPARPALRWLSLTGVALALLPVSQAGLDEWRARKSFPVLADFQQALQLTRFGGQSERRWYNGTMQVQFSQPGPYPGFTLVYFPADWRGYNTLALRLENPTAEPVTLTCRVHDRDHDHQHRDRFNQSIQLAGNSLQRIEFSLDRVRAAPANRSMDLSAIAELHCFGNQQLLGKALQVHFIGLE